MKIREILSLTCLIAAMPMGVPSAFAAPSAAQAQPAGKLQAKFEADLSALRADIAKSLPVPDESLRKSLTQAGEAAKKAKAEFDAAQQNAGKIQTAKALVDHAKGKWIGGAEKGIAEAEVALKAAKTDAERDKAKKDLAHWQANKQDGLKALAERQAALEAAKVDEAKFAAAQATAKVALAKAQAAELSAANALLGGVGSFLSADKLDAKLVKCAVLTEATPRGLAEFSQSTDQAALVDKLLGDVALMREMLVAGGAKGGKYGRAMEIFAAIQKASTKARDGALQRLALATALEHAVPVEQSNAKDATGAPATVDPVKRYMHYEKAFLAGELDPAFKDFTTWEYRMVVECDAPDEILTWGREMLRAYRPDHIATADYGWRYVASVKTDVTYGSQNVSKDLPSLHNYQNIPLNGGVCGRRAFYGRFILRAFGIPVWGVTQHKHAAVSHWTPKGWVVNLGAGFDHSWWDKDDAPRSGSDFLLETQAREHGAEYVKVLRARWASSALGEQAFNDRKKIAGGFWSSIANYQTFALAGKSVTLGPLGKELAEANEKKEKLEQVAAAESDRKLTTSPAGIVIPAVAHEKPSGSFATMKSHGGGQQLHCKGGYQSQLVFEAPQAGSYTLTARVATYTDGQKFLLSPAGSKTPVEAALPFTIGLWQQTQPVTLTLEKGRNVLTISLPKDSRGVTVKHFTLTPEK